MSFSVIRLSCGIARRIVQPSTNPIRHNLRQRTFCLESVKKHALHTQSAQRIRTDFIGLSFLASLDEPSALGSLRTQNDRRETAVER